MPELIRTHNDVNRALCLCQGASHALALRSWCLREEVDHPLSLRPSPYRDMGQLSGNRTGAHPHGMHTFVVSEYGGGGDPLLRWTVLDAVHSEALHSLSHGFLYQLKWFWVAEYVGNIGIW